MSMRGGRLGHGHQISVSRRCHSLRLRRAAAGARQHCDQAKRRLVSKSTSLPGAGGRRRARGEACTGEEEAWVRGTSAVVGQVRALRKPLTARRRPPSCAGGSSRVRKSGIRRARVSKVAGPLVETKIPPWGAPSGPSPPHPGLSAGLENWNRHRLYVLPRRFTLASASRWVAAQLVAARA